MSPPVLQPSRRIWTNRELESLSRKVVADFCMRCKRSIVAIENCKETECPLYGIRAIKKDG